MAKFRVKRCPICGSERLRLLWFAGEVQVCSAECRTKAEEPEAIPEPYNVEVDPRRLRPVTVEKHIDMFLTHFYMGMVTLGWASYLRWAESHKLHPLSKERYLRIPLVRKYFSWAEEYDEFIRDLDPRFRRSNACNKLRIVYLRKAKEAGRRPMPWFAFRDLYQEATRAKG